MRYETHAVLLSGGNSYKLIRCLRVVLLACFCTAFLMFAPCAAYAVEGAFAVGLQNIVEPASAHEGVNMVSDPQDADNDVTFEKSGLVLENGVLTSYGTDGALKPLAGWQLFEGSWYWFDNNAVASASRWILDNDCWYYLFKDGRMATGTFSTPDGSLWHARTSGALTMGPGWAWDGAWYLVDGSGRLSTGWSWQSGCWYWMDTETGVMQTGWFRDSSGTWYLADASGAMLTGWQLRGAWYYLTSSGAMKTGWLWDGAWYWLNLDSGAMATGWLNQGGTWYWLDASGAMTTGWKQIGGAWYWFDGSGAMASSRWVGGCYVGVSGAMVTDGFTPDGYYCGPDGAWQYIYWTPGGERYHRTKDCPMLDGSSRIESGTLGGAGSRTACKVCWH